MEPFAHPLCPATLLQIQLLINQKACASAAVAIASGFTSST
jgi:hypothetical protein